ncbi:MAG: ABC transporter substrate-binding protein [Candidatus Omnitrophica bacterium]|nr:ABC transporter substrate-binding protein [Candidatus Omnitrophota bacterium]
MGIRDLHANVPKQTTQKKSRKRVRCFFALFVCFIIAPYFFRTPSTFSATTHRFGGRLVLSTTTDPKTFNPIVAQETSSTQILNHLFEGLTTIDPLSGEVIPHLAEQWTRNTDGTIWTFSLRQDVRWSDGRPFTARDVFFTFNELIYNPDIITPLKSIFTIDGKNIELSVIDEHTIRFILPSPFAPFLRSLGVSIMPKHVLESAVKNNTFNESWNIQTPLKEIVGTGVFTLARYKPGEKIVLRKNPYYWKKDSDNNRLPYLDEIVFLIIQSQDIALLKFKNGEIDVYGLRGIDYPWLKPLERKEGFTLYHLGPTMSRFFLTFNQNKGINPHTSKPYVTPVKLKWFTNRNFRKAIAHSINKRAIIDLVYNGLAIDHNTTMSPSSGFFYNPQVTAYDFDLEKARQLLREEGIRDQNNDGILEDSEGNPISFNLFISSGSQQGTQLANLIRKDLSSLGVDVNLIQMEFNTLANKIFFTYDWDTMLMGMTGGVEPHFGANVWFSSGPFHMWYPRQTEATMPWETRIDEIFRKGVQELDEEKRKVLYDEWQRIVAEEVPVIYTVIPLQITGVHDRLGNVKPMPLGGVLHNVEEIYTTESKR